MFYVGQKVVCVDGRLTGRYMPAHLTPAGGLDGLTEGVVYTVRGVGVSIGYGDRICLWLNEIVRPLGDFDGHEIGFAAARFRPVVDRKTDISIFTAMLNTKPARIDA